MRNITLISFVIGLALLALGFSVGGCVSNSTSTTQQSLNSAQGTLLVEEVGAGLLFTELQKEVKAGQVKSISGQAASAVIAADKAEVQAIFIGYQTDINDGNLAAIQPDQQNFQQAVSSIVNAAVVAGATVELGQFFTFVTTPTTVPTS
jgi:uncharacterized membrane protein